MTPKNEKPLKIVAFDLDETLGGFIQLGILWDSLQNFFNTQNQGVILNQKMFNSLLDLYPEFLRPHILNILYYLKEQKKAGYVDSVMIFTNNQGPYSWGQYIKNYLEDKIQYKLFDKYIGAWKVNEHIVEKCRTSFEKSLKDLIRCANIHRPVEVCFIDDLLHHDMLHKNVYYIKISPYVYNLPISVIVDRLCRSWASRVYIDLDQIPFFKNYVTNQMLNYNFRYVPKTVAAYEVDKVVSKRTFEFIHDFIHKWNPY